MASSGPVTGTNQIVKMVKIKWPHQALFNIYINKPLTHEAYIVTFDTCEQGCKKCIKSESSFLGNHTCSWESRGTAASQVKSNIVIRLKLQANHERAILSSLSDGGPIPGL